MDINFSYDELEQISRALGIVESVFGIFGDDLKNRIDKVIQFMDTAPITEVYPSACEGVSTVNT